MLNVNALSVYRRLERFFCCCYYRLLAHTELSSSIQLLSVSLSFTVFLRERGKNVICIKIDLGHNLMAINLFSVV